MRWWLLILLVARGSAQSGSCSFERAIQLHQSGDYDAAIREYRKCLTADPVRVQAQSNLGAVLAKLGRYQEAIDQYKEALRSAPVEVAPQLRFNLGLAYYKSLAIPE